MSKILVVDDNVQNLYMLETLLGGNGHEVITAANGAEALQKSRDDLPTVIISDILMPVMDGFALCRQWKADEQLRRIPFVFYTATYTDPKDEEFALSLGAERFIVKPQEPDAFMELLRDVLDDAQTGQLHAPREPETDEAVLMREYNETLIRKLDDKLQQLAAANQDLQTRIDQRNALVQQLETKNAELECYAYAVSHDLKSPLVTINGFLSELSKSAKSGDQKGMDEAITEISDAASSMGRLLSGLLETARLTHTDALDDYILLDESVSEALANLQQTIADRHAQVEVTGHWPVIRGNRVRIIQLLQNLIDNATKFSAQQPEPRVEVGVRTDGDETVFFVADNGIGIKPEYTDQVFGLFNQLDASVDGVGLGLALCKRIVETHGGRIWVESSAEGQGTTFCFTVKVSGDERQ